MRKDGFSLTEIIVVLILMLILGVVATIKSSPYTTMRLDIALQRFLSDIRYAQSLAMHREKIYYLGIDVSENSYGIYDLSGSAVKDPLTQRDLVVDFDEHILYRGVSISNVVRFGSQGNRSVLYFDPWGIPYTDFVDENNNQKLTPPQAEITLSYNEISRTIKIEPYTGRVGIEE